MPWVVTDQGTNSSTSGATIVLTVAANVAIGSLVVVGICDRSNASSGGSMIDSAGNSYSPIVSAANNADSSRGFGAFWYSVTTLALTGGSSTITYTKVTSGAKAVISALSAVTGTNSPIILDASVTASATAGSSPCTVVSGIPSFAGELFVGLETCGNGKTLTSDAAHGWISPPLSYVQTGTLTTDVTSVGAYEVNSGVGAITYSPTGTSIPALASFVIGFSFFDATTVPLEATEIPRLVKKRMVGY